MLSLDGRIQEAVQNRTNTMESLLKKAQDWRTTKQAIRDCVNSMIQKGELVETRGVYKVVNTFARIAYS